MKKKQIKGFKVWTRKESKLVPANMFAIENKYGWFVGQQVEGKWYINSIDTDKAPIDLKTLIKHWKALMSTPAPQPEPEKPLETVTESIS
jgi:hypothetical protein